MDKIYITKTKLNELLTSYAEVNNDYPKPVLTLIAVILTIIMIGIAIIASILVLLGVLAYLLLFWIDLIVGKYIIKRIFKL
jgi:CHASE1-domain containing sensor protein